MSWCKPRPYFIAKYAYHLLRAIQMYTKMQVTNKEFAKKFKDISLSYNQFTS